MKDFLAYIYEEVKNKRLNKEDASELLFQFETQVGSSHFSLIHPLLHQNTSNLSGQRFSSTFIGDEFFIKDYIIKGHRNLPGAIGLEMARVAVTIAMDSVTTDSENEIGLSLKDIIWDQPFPIEKQPFGLHIRLFSETNGEIFYQIYGLGGTDQIGDETEPIIHSQGRVVVVKKVEPQVLDINSLKEKCSQNMISSAEIYDQFKMIGIEYGLGYQVIEQMYIGTDQVLAKLAIPADLAITQSQYHLHPSLMEAAFQAATRFMGSIGTKIFLPTALQELEIYGKCTPVMWVTIEHSPEDETKIDINLCNEQGKILVKMKGYSVRELEVEAGAEAPLESSTPMIKKMLFKIDWKDQDVSKDTPLPEYDEHRIILCEMAELCTPEQLQEQLGNGLNIHCLALQSGAKKLDKRFQYHSIQVFEEIQKICKEKPDQNIFMQIVYPNQGEYRLMAGLSGLLITAHAENSQLIAQLIEIEPGESPAKIADKLTENRRVPTITHVRYQDGKRWTSGWSQLEVSLEETSGEVIKPWKDKGVYLISGGTGGLGLIFAKEIAVNTKDAIIILTGRSLLSREKQARIKAIESIGARIVYEQVDVTDKKGIQELIQRIKAEYGGLNGIIHSAGFFCDNLIIKKTKEEIVEVLAPKVSGLLNLDEASRDLNLDFFILFSSSSAVNGNPGQVDYATANAFLDAYAGYRNSMVASHQRFGRTLAMNWPFWKDGGMQVSAEVEKFWRTTGIVPMETQTGIRALYEGLLSGNDQAIVVVEDYKQILNSNAETARNRSKGRRAELRGLSLEKCLEWELKFIINRLLKIPREKIENKKNLMEFGFNSIGLSQFAIQLNKHLGIADLTPALFFRYSNIESLVQYLATKYHALLEEVYREGANDGDILPKSLAMTPLKRLIQGNSKARLRFIPRATSTSSPDFFEPIAIIGMSGKFPGAQNIDELWEVLANGQDMVKEIPEERFDWRQYYSEQIEPGKTICKWCGCISGVSEFDPMFFEISPREAEVMDPQQRLLLQEAWRALEDAGYGAAQIKKEKIGMFVGVEQGDYQYIAGEASATSDSIAILASRLAYFLDLHGPVMAIDTACSSGLVAAHQAFLSLRNGECDTAIVAGVRLLLTPLMFTILSEAGMLSNDGKCHTFAENANGLVPGEAVAAVVFKRLSQAEADGDPIYAIIKGSGINYDGKTNGINAPSGNAQIALLKDVYNQYRINPEEIDYVVTHGTGTKLGDPVEINALYDVFKDYTKRQNYCALTSTKTNFGHTMAASGLVSLINLVQALRHETIPASLHCEKENDYINWQESPFYVNKTNKLWPAGGKIRTGAISAFGASGTNAHMVVQSYSPKEDVTQKSKLISPYYLLALSAKTEESLQEKIKDIIAILKDKDHRDQDLTLISYTLLNGRQHFNHRCAIVIQDREDAIYVLKQVGSKEKLPNLFQGKVPWNFTGHKVIEEYIYEQIKRLRTAGKNKHQYQEILLSLADLYCQGYEIDWKQLFGDSKLQRLHLPTYPFAKEHYWVSADMIQNLKGGNEQSLSPIWIHPLLQQNTSDLSEQRYSSIFNGKEFFVTDHVVRGQKVLSRFAGLEMARAGIESAVGNTAEDRAAIKLTNIIWIKSIEIEDQSLQVNFRINPDRSGELNFEVYSPVETDNSEVVIYSQGKAVLNANLENQVLDLKALQAECNRWKISGSDIYNTYKTIGLEYGPGYQGIEMLYIGQDLVLAKLSLPSSIADTEKEYTLHPSMMEAAFQAVIGFTTDLSKSKTMKPMVPFALQELEILGNTTSSMWALIRCGEGNKIGTGTGRLDIDLCDAQGQICVRLKGLEIREDTEISTSNAFISNSQEPYELMTFEEIWQEQALEQSQAELGTIVCFLSDPVLQQEMSETLTTLEQQAKLIFISQGPEFQKQTSQSYIISRTNRKTYEEAFQNIRADYGEINTILYMWTLDDPSCIKDYSCIVYMIQTMATTKLRTKQVLLAASFEKDSLERCYLESWIGFERSLGIIMRDLQFAAMYQVIEENQPILIKDWVQKIRLELKASKIRSVLYQNKKRHIYRIQPVKIQAVNSLLKPDATYLITGGCGGLGFLFAKYISQKHPVNLILTGRTALDTYKEKKLKTLEELGSQAIYLQTDVGNLDTMSAKLKQAKERFGAINGVIHTAGLPDDKTIFTKELEEFEKVLSPKITGTLVLDQLLKEEPLDFVCYFSSSAAILGDFGSCDYSVGNRFLMAYAHYRNWKTSQGISRGKTVAINWPLWREGGMGFDNDENTKMYLKTSGQRILEAEEGVAAFDQLLGQTHAQYLIITGRPSQVHRFLGLTEAQPVTAPPIRKSGSSEKRRRIAMKGLSVEQCLEWDLKEFINRLLKIPREKIESEKNLADFGFNSMGLTQFSILLIKHFGIEEITPAIFYGYSTIEKLIQYFIQNHPETIRQFYREADEEKAILDKPLTPQPVIIKPNRFSRNSFTQSRQEPIAIIGMSGRFPGANNINELWSVLAAGANMVREIPKERFDWRQYYGDPNKEPGKISSKWCGYISGVSAFDPLFFEISPREAEYMDPRQRLLLEESWKSLEDAGYGSEQIQSQKIGMFVGVEQGDYEILTNGNGNIGSNHNGILAARLAYFLNLNGPVMAIDTACSSGLVAAHQAISSIRNGDCDTAIAAGVNIMVTPNPYIAMSQAGMLSSDGKCYVFDQRANGMVPGEAVAVVVLKGLSQAEADGDPIYAVIKGNGINYDGKTNGITAPSGTSQTKLLKMVYDQFRINPEEIEYIVTHGTGTKIGDPIEINALYDAFKDYTKKQGYCALTSTKTNFGHTFAASGLVSLISLVQALRHEIIPASLHCEQENNYINWKESPFFVNKTNKTWTAEKTRLGAVSAFGMTGTNVHMVVESYCSPKTESSEEVPYYMLVLSAKTRESLLEKATDLVNLLENDINIDLSQLSYTLLQGRQHFSYRCALVIQEREDAVYGLKQIESKEKVLNLFQGKVLRDFTGQKSIEEYAQELLKQSQTLKKNKLKYQQTLFALADLYCQGYELDWNGLFGECKPRRLHLPTYPFAKEHCWAPESDNQIIDGNNSYEPAIHPLLHQNTSDLTEQRYSTIFTGKEFFLANHVVNGQKILPGVAYLEMVRAAVEIANGTAIGDLISGQTGMRFKNIIWARPVVIDTQPVQIHTGLFPEESGEIAFEIYSGSDQYSTERDTIEPVVYSQGKVNLNSIAAIPSLNLKDLQTECTQKILSTDEVYESFAAIGMGYGPVYRGIEAMYVGQDQILVKLSLPASISETEIQFMLHPIMLDLALTSAGFMMGLGNLKPLLPNTLQELEIFNRCTSKMWALIRHSNVKSNGSIVTDKTKFNIDLCDDQGIICVRMTGYSARVLEGQVNLIAAAEPRILMLKTGWKEQLAVPETIFPEYNQRLVVFCELARLSTDEVSPANISSQMNSIRFISLQSKQIGIDKRFQSYAVQVFEEVQRILKDKITGKTLIQIVIPNQGEARIISGLSGFLKTARDENPKLFGQIIEVSPDEDATGIITKLIESGNYPHDAHIRYQDGKRWVLSLHEIETGYEAVSIPWKDGGIYLITGGTGGLGRIFAGEIAGQVKDATIILTGRSPLSLEKQSKLNELAETGVKVRYWPVDVSDKKGVADLIQSIQAEFGGLNGIIHSAGVIHDNFIIKKTKEEWQEVLVAKVSGLVNLDMATRDLKLDFFILFSSISGVFGSAGQADYSTANAFMNAYATYRNHLVSLSQRQGRTLSINWPLWKEGGMHVDQETEKMLIQNYGMIAMKTETGIRALYYALASGQEQVIIMEGNRAKIKERMLGTASQAPAHTAKMAVPTIASEQLRDKTLSQLKVLFSEVTGLNVSRIDGDEPLESYGIDSLMIMQLNPKLDAIFGELSKTLFFEYQTLGALTEYLTAEYPQECMKWTGLGELHKPVVETMREASAQIDVKFPILTSWKTGKKGTRSFTVKTFGTETRESIAIIGISGRYPQARTLQDFWRNLLAGKDCISEIPAERWPLEGFYHPDPEAAVAQGKSYCKWGGFVDGFSEFDPLFFNIAPRDAFDMDPQERLFLESCWEALEDAGYTKEQLAVKYQGRVGVFAGITRTGFDLYGPDLWRQGEKIFPSTSFSSVANRVSYLLNLQGPSMPIDTMCSSSLTAVHEACEHLLHGECEMAIAGGVNLYLHPSNYIGLCGQFMLSKDGQNRSFGRGANGFVPGEGVGIVLLKRLSQAVADQDQIYAVIRGTNINHGGKTNGYTVPNPKAQGELIRAALEKSGVNARAVSYIEAHGTGTELGDPIEITGLTQAFRKDTEDIGYCAIGSLKSNIGHLEAAAGIAGLTKIVLQMKNRQIVPSLHAEEINPNINFIKTPFIIQQELTEWERPVVSLNGETREYPRIAGISSFGAGGSNAHVIIEEYLPYEQEQLTVTVNPQPTIVILSARNEERLKEQVKRLISAIRERELTDANLADIAYTLQVGREVMEERLGVITHSIEELTGKLAAYIEGQSGIADFYRGQVKRNQETLTIFTVDEDLQKAVESWVNKGKYGKLLELWVKGMVFDWQRLYGENKPRRISLPTYPFAKERYWVPEAATKSIGTNNAITFAIHPLLQQNTSNLSEQRYSSTFTGEEFFLADHIVNGQKLLPGVAYLEMARAAIEEAVVNTTEELWTVKLKNVIWARPIGVDKEPIQVHIGLYPEDSSLIQGDSEIAYEIYSLAENSTAEPLVYSQGSAILTKITDNPVVDLNALQAECNGRKLSGTEMYSIYKTIGLDYGPGHQGVEMVYTGQGRVLAKLSLPTSVSGSEAEFVLHPSIMDAALQASIAMETEEQENMAASKPSLPFALQELEVYLRCTESMWATIQYSKDNKESDKIQKLDIDICDEQGNVCVRLKGYTSRVLESGIGETSSVASSESLIWEPIWKEQTVLNSDSSNVNEYLQQLVILFEPGTVSQESIKSGLNGVSVLSLQSKQKNIAKRFESYTVQVFETIQKILTDKTTGKVLIQLVYASRGEQQVFAGLSGILKTAGLENPKVIGQIIEVETMDEPDGIIAKLRENSYHPMDSRVRYQGGKRQVAGWSEVMVAPETAAIPWKNRGVYLITGGTGGLGRIFAKEIVAQAKDVTLVLTGRSSPEVNRKTNLMELESNGAKVIYRQMDVTDKKAVNELIASIGEEFGKLDGIIHSAGVIRDNYIIKKTTEELVEVMAPKVIGLVNLDEASQDLNLDFMILFSSSSGSMGNSGQADYAVANAFMDAYAEYRNALVSFGKRRGRTLSINWPLWQEGGMRVDEKVEKMMLQDTGLIALRTKTGIRALYDGIASRRTQVMVMEGDIRQIRAMFSKQPDSAQSMNLGASQKKQESGTVANQGSLREKVSNYLKKLLAPVIKLSEERIDADTPMENYGIDSIMVMELTNQLEKTFGSLSKTLFFEYQTIRGLSGYFLDNYYEKLNVLMGIGIKVEVPNDTDTLTQIKPVMSVAHSRKRPRFAGLQFMVEDSKPNGFVDIAIIGVSGKYPQARNLDEFWKNLRDGKDCITEIPKERWDHSRYYDEDKNKPGKIYHKWGGFIDGVDQFDPLFFNISPRVAECMDPQERLFLECVYETLEDAGYTRNTLGKYQGLGLEGNVGVYVGVMYEEYQLYGAQAQIQGFPVVLSGNPSSIANRVSYFCNFHGPSLALDSMCSSSLTAIHLACQSIQRGGCELAIAGGVNVSVHPNKYLGLAQDKFASSKGRCESFGEGGDGYVPGEGVGAVLLKPLSKAIVDGDQIYGVIKGTAINHGGKTNGYTVPNPNAQAGVIEQALQEARLDSRTISYIEAHGTGTSLGDPIEITGLVKAFQKYTEIKQFCTIGSAKSNIGHCESAAGIAGVTKVLLQLKNRQIAPSLHSEVLNPNIDFLNTPFIVQQELTEWERPVVTIEGVTKEYPRIAGISSFGAGGSNGHIIIEEYIPKNQEQPVITATPQQPAIVILSARNEEQLRMQAKRLMEAIRERELTDANLADIAYTLQVGRETMEERLGIITRSIEELTGKLAAFIAGQSGIEDLYHGQVKRNQETLTVITADEEMQEAIQKWIVRKKYGKLLNLWVKGLIFDWNKLYGDQKPHRISLPTYPFARERYWVPEIDTKKILAPNMGISSYIHPLLQQNISNLSEQSYSSTFTGAEFFLADHVVNGQKVLPGVAYLEMARAAVEAAATGSLANDRMTIKLKNVIWARPIRVGEEPARVHIGLYPEDNGEIHYEIYDEVGTEDGVPLVYSQGRAILTTAPELPVLDLKAVQAECSQRVLQTTEVYEIYRAMGIEYGPGHRGIKTIYVGRACVLAELSLPPSVADSETEFVLHPSIMDAALQASIAMEAGSQESMAAPKPSLPFALQELEIYRRCTGSMWAKIQYSNDNTASDKVQKLDIDICDEQGNVCVQLKGYTSRVLEGGISETGSVANTGSLMLEPVWKEQAVLNSDSSTINEYIQQVVILCEPGTNSLESIERGLNGAGVLSLQSKQKSIAKRFEVYSVRVFETIQKIITDKTAGKVLIQLVYASQGEQQVFAGLSGILKTAQSENPKIIGQIIEVDTMDDPERLIAKLKENNRRPLDSQVRYREGKRQMAGWSEVTVAPDMTTTPWKSGGVYLITGGAGGLGRIFAKEIAAQAKDVTLVLTGRSSLEVNRKTNLMELESNGAKVIYRQMDVTDKKAVNELIASISEEFGKLNGIIHSAGVIRDNYIIKKDKEEFIKVMAPKVIGLENLDEASKDVGLDYMILFSSTSGCMGNLGQADYAAANAFMDAYAGYRNALASSGRRRGRTLSINWPLWQEGGMRVDEKVEKMMEQDTGMVAMRTKTGLQALYDGIASGRTQVMVMEGDIRQIRAAFIECSVSGEHLNMNSTPTKPEILSKLSQDQIKEKTSNYLKKMLSPIIKLPAERIEADTLMEKYGIDSIMVMELTNQLEKTFGSLSKTLFYEYQTIRELSGYFLEFYREQLNQLLDFTTNQAETGRTQAVMMAETIPQTIRSRKRSRFTTLQPMPDSNTNKSMDIAVIGVSGRYPQARNLDEFWEILRDGKDCITEIPKNRWDHSLYYDENKDNSGKTYSKWGGFLEGVDQFDPLFFNISPREAETMNPQERLFLETVWSLLESVGYTHDSLKNIYQSRIGVFAGAMDPYYQPIDSQSPGLSLDISSIANRVSYYFDFQGPSIAINTVCSSSGIAIHMACESLIRGECRMAIAGGVNLVLHPQKFVDYSSMKMIGSHPNSRSFGDGDGFLLAEGVGVVLLKPLAQAIQDRDNILAVIKSTAINHGGHTNGYMVPNPNLQAQLILDNFRKSGIDPRTISYVEAAALGSAMGDPIEVTALTKAFGQFTRERQFCGIGSVQSNMGHPEAASGISQLTKVILQLQHQQLVPSIKSEPLNPQLNFEQTPFYLQRELQEWERPVIRLGAQEQEFPRRATISSFGAGGSNVHLIVEEYIPAQAEPAVSIPEVISPRIVVLSAKNKERLQAVVQQMLDFIESRKDISLLNLAYTLQVGREAMEVRVAMVVSSIAELIQSLKKYLGAIPDNQASQTFIPVFTGESEINQLGLSNLLTGKTEETLLQSLLEENNNEKLAQYWVSGGKIPWESLYQNVQAQKIALPTYPFARERYWLFKSIAENQPVRLVQTSRNETGHFRTDSKELLLGDIRDYLIKYISGELNLTPDRISINQGIGDYGANSITIIKMLRDIEKRFDIKITNREMLELKTIESIAGYLSQKILSLHYPVNNPDRMNQFDTNNVMFSNILNDPEIDIYEKFKNGLITLEEAEDLLAIGGKK